MLKLRFVVGMLALGMATAQNGPVYRVSTQLAQIDAVVTDAKGRHVRDLQAADFVAYQDGRKQQLRSCAWVDTSMRTAGPHAIEGTRLLVLVNDLSISAESLGALHNGLRKLIDSQMQPGDSMAIALASRSGLFRAFTSDRDKLRASIREIPSHLHGRTDIGAVEPIAADPTLAASPELARLAAPDSASPKSQTAHWAVSNALNMLARLPGRKGLVIVSDGDPVKSARGMASLANRASTVVYYIDPRGINATAFIAADVDTLFGVRIAPSTLAGLNGERGYDIARSQLNAGLLPALTGGIAIQNSNDFSGAMDRILDDLRGYYLLSYRPALGSMDGAGSDHAIVVKVRGPGLHVRARRGLPVGGGDTLRVRLTPFVWQTAGEAPALKAYVHIDAIEYWPESFSLTLTLMDEEGRAVDRLSRSVAIDTKGKRFEVLRKYGYVATLDLPLPRPGLYWLWAQATDKASQGAGSAGQPIAVPGLASTDRAVAPAIRIMLELPAADEFAAVSSAALRKFHRGDSIAWYCQVFHPESAGLKGQMQLMSGDTPIHESRMIAIDGVGSPTNIHGRIRLGEGLGPGLYSLRFLVGGAGPTIDFEILQ